MSSQSTYQAARVVAPEVETHFARHLAAANKRGEKGLAPGPDARTIEAIIDAVFWASLRREEGHSPKISLAFLSLEHQWLACLFGRKECEGDQLQVWGATRLI